MPGTVSIPEAAGQPTIPADADFAIVVIGSSTTTPLDDGAVSTPYASPSAFADDYGIGDGVDAVLQAVKRTPGNPAPPPVSFYRTPPTTGGAYGTIDVSLMVGTAIPAEDTSTSPKGTYQARVRVADDGNDGAGTAVGSSGVVLQASVDDGRTWLPTSALGTATSFTIYLPAATPIDTGVRFKLQPPSPELSALYTKLNLLRTALIAHFIIVSGGTPVHGAADTTDNTALTAVATATTPATAVTLFNAMLARLGLHGANTGGSYHTGTDATLATALAAISVAVNVTDVDLKLNALITAYNAHRVNVSSVHGSADGTNTVTAFSASPPTLITGDEWSIPTTPPMWGASDLFSAGPPATGAFAAIAEGDYNFAIIAISEPVASSDFATITAGLDYMLDFGKEPWLFIRFRDPTAGETDSAYVTAFRAFAAACVDDRVTCCMGSGRLTDAFRGYVYHRSGMPAVLARLQSNSVIPGKLGERIAQHPGYVARGALENFSLVDSGGALIGHDEKVRGGVDGPIGATGGGLTFYRVPNPDIRGTYVSEAPVLYPSAGTILTLMDRRLANGIKRVAAAIAWQEIQGADVWDPVTFELDADLRDGIVAKIASAIAARYGGDNPEFQNYEDPNLVTIDPTVSVSGSKVAITGSINVRFYGYTQSITLTFKGSR